MKRSLLATIVAILSILIHLILSIITCLNLINELQSNDWVFHVLLAIALVVEIIVLAASISLIYGIKQELPHFASPWLYVIAIYMILNIVDFLDGYNALGFLFPIKFVVAALHTAFWFIIYKHLPYMRAK